MQLLENLWLLLILLVCWIVHTVWQNWSRSHITFMNNRWKLFKTTFNRRLPIIHQKSKNKNKQSLSELGPFYSLVAFSKTTLKALWNELFVYDEKRRQCPVGPFYFWPWWTPSNYRNHLFCKIRRIRPGQNEY